MEPPLRLVTFSKTFVGRPAPAAPVARSLEVSAEIEVELEDAEPEDRTVPCAITFVTDSTETAMFTADMLAELRAKLRMAEEREASGVRALPSEPPQEKLDVEETFTDPDALFSSLPEIEIPLSWSSESNFYARPGADRPEGVFLAGDAPIAVGTRVYANVLFMHRFAFRTPAVVAWSRDAAEGPPGIGVVLEDLDERMTRLVTRFAQRRAPLCVSSSSERTVGIEK
jgi:hypothetical protein